MKQDHTIAFSQAMNHQSDGRLNEAVDIYRSILSQTPDHIPSLEQLGLLHMQRKQYFEAESLLGRASSLDPRNQNLCLNYALCKLNLGNPTEAIAIIERVIVINPDNNAANLLLSSILLPGPHYLECLDIFHRWLKPAVYLEIGVETGRSMSLAKPPSQCIGIDPAPQIIHPFAALTRIFTQTSDDFFARDDVLQIFDHNKIAMAFIDGLHVFEAVLRDFINVENLATRNSVILIHDCIPLNEITSERERKTQFWSGDTWKIVPCLKKYRPDLAIFTFPAPPTGLCIVTNLNPDSQVLAGHYAAIINEYVGMKYEQIRSDKTTLLNIVDVNLPTIIQTVRNCWQETH
ncbi:MAG: tetratricopeptide repeat protein [Gammaproteobacteria bacterium]|nr:tetratricopeptide repeat protein [Gammaproteobacteria bacterium]